MKPDRATLGGFENPSEGWHSFVIGDDVSFMKKRDEEGNATDELSDTVSFPIEVIDDEAEKGRKGFMNCDLSKAGGRTSCARILHFITLGALIEKNMKIDGDCNEKEWGEKYLDPSKKTCDKIIQAMVAKSPGKPFDGRIKNSDYKGKTYANVVELAMYKDADKGGKAEKADDSKASGAPPKTSGDDDVGDW